jgi:hypothetical protein
MWISVEVTPGVAVGRAPAEAAAIAATPATTRRALATTR